MEEIKQHLYRHFDERGKLLYVGVSLSTIQRLAQHKHHSHWFNSIEKITIEQFPSREEALDAEKIAIQKEDPLHNLALKNIPNPKMLRITEDKKEESCNHLIKSIVSCNPIYTIDEAAILFKVGASKIKEWCENGRLGHVEIGRQWDSRWNKWIIKKRITGWQILDYIENLEITRQLTEKWEKKEYTYLSDLLRNG